MVINSKELGKTKEGWKIKVVVNEKSGVIVYLGYFETNPRSAPIMLSSDNLEDLRDKISKSKYCIKKDCSYKGNRWK